MAKGKQAAVAAQRRYEAAVEHIDRLTSELAEAKMRARSAEARAQRLEGVEKHLEASSSKRDELVLVLTKKLEWWEKVRRLDEERRKAACAELCRLGMDICSLGKGGAIGDGWEFARKRYPRVVQALMASEHPVPVDPTYVERAPDTCFSKRLSGESRRRWNRLTGREVDLGGTGVPMADALIDLLDARQAGFTKEEVVEFMAIRLAGNDI